MLGASSKILGVGRICQWRNMFGIKIKDAMEIENTREIGTKRENLSLGVH